MGHATGNQARRPSSTNDVEGPESQPVRREPATERPPRLNDEQEKHDTIPAPAWFDEDTD